VTEEKEEKTTLKKTPFNQDESGILLR